MKGPEGGIRPTDLVFEQGDALFWIINLIRVEWCEAESLHMVVHA